MRSSFQPNQNGRKHTPTLNATISQAFTRGFSKVTTPALVAESAEGAAKVLVAAVEGLFVLESVISKKREKEYQRLMFDSWTRKQTVELTLD